MVYLELASFGKTEVLDLDRVFAKKGYVLVDFNSMCSSYFTQCSRIKFLFFFQSIVNKGIITITIIIIIIIIINIIIMLLY